MAPRIDGRNPVFNPSMGAETPPPAPAEAAPPPTSSTPVMEPEVANPALNGETARAYVVALTTEPADALRWVDAASPAEETPDVSGPGFTRATQAPGLNAGQLGNLNAVVDAVNASGLEGEAAEKALLVLTTAARENDFSALTGAPQQLRDGTTGLFNLPERNSMGELTTAERNDVSTALDRLLDADDPGSLVGLVSREPSLGLGAISDELGIATARRSEVTESVDFLEQAGVLSPESTERLRGAVAVDETLTDQTWDVASFSGDGRSYDYWADQYRPSFGQSFDAPRQRSWGRDYHNGFDLMGGNQDVYSAFGNGEVVSTTAWGSGAWDPGSGSSSNAVRVAYDLPGRDGQFLVDYGHLQMNRTLDVKVGDTIEAGQDIGRTAFDDTWSRGGHLDVKIRIPSSLAGEFPPGDTRAASDGMSFVDPQVFMQWYREQASQL